MATSLDGRIAYGRAQSPLSTPEGRRSAHVARARHDAVLVGNATLQIDDPRLTVRDEADVAAARQPLRVVLASALEVAEDARTFREPGSVLVIGTRERGKPADVARVRSLGADVALVPADAQGMVSLAPALEALAERGVKQLLVEGGSLVLTSFFRDDLVDTLEMEVAMQLFGTPGIPVVGAIGWMPRLADIDVSRLGANVLVRGRVVK